MEGPITELNTPGIVDPGMESERRRKTAPSKTGEKSSDHPPSKGVKTTNKSSKSKKVWKKKTGTKTTKNQTLVNGQIADLVAKVNGNKDAEREKKKEEREEKEEKENKNNNEDVGSQHLGKPSVSRRIGAHIFINPWSLKTKVSFQHEVLPDDKVSISGTFTFGTVKENFVGTYPIYRRGRIYASSNCRTIIYAHEDIHDETGHLSNYCDVTEGDCKERLKNFIPTALGKLDWGRRWSRKDQFASIKSRYTNFYGDYQTLDRDLNNMMESALYTQQVERAVSAWEDNWQQTTEHRLRTEFVRTGDDFEKKVSKLVDNIPWYNIFRYRLTILRWASTLAATAAAGYLGYKHLGSYQPTVENTSEPEIQAFTLGGLDDIDFMFVKEPEPEISWVQALLTTVTKTVIEQQKAFKIAAIMAATFVTTGKLLSKSAMTRKEAVKVLSDQYLISNFSLIPANMAFIRKMNYDHAAIQDLPMLPVEEFDIRVEYDPVDVESSERVEIYGTTIDMPSVYPCSNDQNLDAALRIRMGFDREINNASVNKFIEFAKAEIDKMPIFIVEPTTEERANNHLRKQYGEKTAQRIMRNYHKRLKMKHNEYQAFVKKEIYLKEKFKPRMIWCCPDIILAKFSYFFHDLTKNIKSYWDSTGRILYTSGKTPSEVGRFVASMEEHPLITESDVSNWDGSMLHCYLLLEKYLLSKVQGAPEELPMLLNFWADQVAKSKSGKVKVKSVHGRRSGDLWTSVFNTLLNILFTRFCFENPKDWKIIVQGDDNGFSCVTNTTVEDVKKKYAELGLKCEIIVRARAQDMTFCSGRLWKVDGSLKWGNSPFRTLAKFGLNHNNLDKKLYKRLLYGTAKSLLPTCGHVPIVQAIMRAVVSSAESIGLTPYYADKDLKYKIHGGLVTFPDEDTYTQFSELYNIDEFTVKSLEDFISKNFHINQCPYILDDPLFRLGYSVDTGIEISNNPRLEAMFGDGDVNEIFDDAVKEEKLKLVGVTSFNEAVKSGYRFGEEEDRLAGTTSHAFLHATFSALSFINFAWGVSLHQAYNSLAYALAGIPCNKNKIKNKNKNKNAKPKKQGGSLKNAIKAAVATGLRAGGAGIGGYLGGVKGAGFGRDLGAKISQLIGAGDYEIVENSLMKGHKFAGVPAFRDAGASMRLAFRELIGDVKGSVDFTATTYALNPGLAATFPFASGIAKCYTEYELKGLVFYFNSTCAEWNGVNAALGTVIMATRMNPSDPDFTSKRDMAQSYYACTTKPSQSAVHGIECDEKMIGEDRHYIRTGTTTDDLKFYDWGKFTLATVGMNDTSIVGELWVSYDVEFKFPKVGLGGPSGYAYIGNRGVTSTDLLGPIQTTPVGSLPMTVVAFSGGYNSIKLGSELSSGSYRLVISWGGDAAGVTTSPTVTLVNATAGPSRDLYGAAGASPTSLNTGTSARLELCLWFTIDSWEATGTEIRLTPGTLPIAATTNAVSISIYRWDI